MYIKQFKYDFKDEGFKLGPVRVYTKNPTQDMISKFAREV